MFGMTKWLKAQPAGPRIVLSLLIAIGCGWAVIKLSVGIWVDDTVEGLSEVTDIEYESTFFKMNGDFGIKEVRVVDYDSAGNESGTFLVDRVVVHPPGFFWLLRNSWFRTTRDLPDEISVTLENARNAAVEDSTPGNYSNLPYDAIGCGVKLLTPAHFAEMGFPQIRRDVTVGLKQIGGARAALHFDMSTVGIGALAMDFDIGFPRPVKWRDTLIALMQAPVGHLSLSMQDQGFVAARNSYCASKNSMTNAAFQDFHNQSLSSYLQEYRLGFSEGTWSRYRQFAKDGGELELASNNERPMPLERFVSMGRDDKFHAFPLQLSLDGGPGTAFAFEPAGAVTAVLPGATDAEPSSAAVAKSAAAPQDPVAEVSGEAAVARAISYRDLEHLVGTHIQVMTTNGTTRTGTLVAYGSLMSSMKLDPAEGGFVLAIPASTVSEVYALDQTVALDASLPAKTNAKTN